MHRSHRAVLLLIGCVTLVAAGCTRTYRVTFEMTPDSVASVQVVGAGSLAMVENEGPGVVRATFDADHELASSLTVAAGTASGQTLHGSRMVRLETGDASASVRVEVRSAKGLVVDAASPK